jgi:glycosyltransferase involved in cell wall biosynthesis
VKIGILSPVWFPVPPVGYGGIEVIVSLLADGLVEAGHEVTLFASGDSTTLGELDAVFDEAPSGLIGQTFWELYHAINCFERHSEFDLIHDHTGLLGLSLGSLLPTPIVHTVHGPLTGAPGQLYKRITGLVPRTCLVSLSLAQRRPHPDLPWLANVPNAIDVGAYPLHAHQRGDYLLFLGRMNPDKGAHRAIQVAQQVGMPLKLAGKVAEPAEQEYFNAQVRPHLKAGIEFIGEVDQDDKVELLHGAIATLFPIDWEEPFGLVMVESMACGTPVIASRRGSVPEVIDDGITGIIVDDWNPIDDALDRAANLDPQALRSAVEQRFSPVRMVADYIAAYKLALSPSVSRRAPRRRTPQRATYGDTD